MVRLSKEESIKRINLRKDKIISLAKSVPELSIPARVGLVLDRSGSMNHLYNNGSVQEVIERIFPLALKFNKSSELDFWVFEDSFNRLPNVTFDNFYNLVETKLNPVAMGGTNYAPVLYDVLKRYVAEKPLSIPSYVIFITDGENYDRNDAEEAITNLSRFPIFFQFIGIGLDHFDFLEHLDNMEGRYVDNANFFHVNQLSDMDDDALYCKLLAEYPQWLQYAEVKAMLEKPQKNSQTARKFLSRRRRRGFFRHLFDALIDDLD